ncbi:protein YhfH [Jeotgalibacillus soli]
MITMLENVMEFYRNIPPKQCASCGDKMEEQAEAYSTVCDKCSSSI